MSWIIFDSCWKYEEDLEQKLFTDLLNIPGRDLVSFAKIDASWIFGPQNADSEEEILTNEVAAISSQLLSQGDLSFLVS